MSLVVSCVFWIDRPVRAELIAGTLYFSTYTGSGFDRVHSATFDYNSTNQSLSFSPTTNILTNQLIGADDIIFAPDGKTLLTGGEGPYIFRVDPSNGHVLNALYTCGIDVYHLALSPDGKTVYGGGSEANSPGVAVVPTNPYGTGATESIRGSNQIITQIAFDTKGNAYYTSSADSGYGNFGTITGLGSSPVTNALITNLPAAHGIVYDPFTGDFILVGSNEIAQVDPSGHIISYKLFSGIDKVFDQDSVDGQGHLFVTNPAGGNLLFVDYSKSGLIGDPSNFTQIHFLDNYLDDIAPLVGPGGGGLAVPEPASFVLLSLSLAGLAVYGWRSSRKSLRKADLAYALGKIGPMQTADKKETL